jgi:MFS transporter, putative metabolite:H+ symporter
VAWGLGLPTLLRSRVDGGGWRVRSLDAGPLSPAHVGLASILVVALVIDVMKPATLSFVAPGAAIEYQMPGRSVALWWPLTALIGTVVGSLIWGRLADRAGRRPAMYMATLFFIGTSMCGTMPTFGWNLVVCFLMGMSAGGMLPLVFTLMAEVMPSRHRGWLSVLIGGAGTVGGYLTASGAAYLLEPIFGWRILWLIGLPTGLVLLGLIRFIPESPRHLLLHGRTEAARAVLQRFGARLDREPDSVESRNRGRVGELLRPPYVGRVAGLGLYAVGWGLVNFGFLTWLPTILRAGGLSGPASNQILSRSALVAVPGVVLMVWMYAKWRTNLALAIGAISIASALLAIGLLHPQATTSARFLVPALGFLLAACGGSNAALTVYSAEVFPTGLRGTGTGLIAGSSKFGGVIGPPAVAAIFTLSPGLLAPAWILAIPMAVAAMVLWSRGPATGGRALEDISS